MTAFLAEEDFNNDILRGLLRRAARTDVVRVQDLGLRGATDDAVLASAAEAGRVLLTHDSSTLFARAFARVLAGERMPSVIVVSQATGVGVAIDDLVLVAECSSSEDWNDQVRYVPLR